MSRTIRRVILGVLIAAVALTAAAAAPGTSAGATTDRPVFSGQATAVDAKVLGLELKLADTGYYESPAFDSPGPDCTEQGLAVPQVSVQAELLCASTQAAGNESASHAHVAGVDATVAGIPVSATLLSADATSTCDLVGGIVAGEVDIADARVGNFYIDADPLLPTPRNEPIVIDPITGTFIVIGERTTTRNGNYSALTITALRVVVPGVADVRFATAHADVRCQGRPVCPSPSFITGGGFLAGKRHLTAMFRDGDLTKGHVQFSDKARGLKFRGVKPWTSSEVFGSPGEGSGQLIGYGELTENGVARPGLVPFRLYIVDNGEPGRNDTYELDTVGAAGKLEGGNFQAHKPCKNAS